MKEFTLALIAHDARKENMVQLVKAHTAEAVLHLLFEHPEALSGHHLEAQFLEEMAPVHN